jgi:hypothetical protein
MEDCRTPAQIAQAKRAAVYFRQFKIGSHFARFYTARFNGSSPVFYKNFSFEMLVIVFIELLRLSSSKD